MLWKYKNIFYLPVLKKNKKSDLMEEEIQSQQEQHSVYVGPTI